MHIFRKLCQWVLGVVMVHGSVALAATLAVQHVEPPHWWVGMVDTQLQVMVHAPGVGALDVDLRPYPGVRLAGVQRTRNPNYLFVDLVLQPDAQPGQLRLEFRRDAQVVGGVDYPLRARRAGSAQRRGFDASDAIYLLMPDRFANGDPSNDVVAGMGDVTDRAVSGARHGGDLAGMQAHLDYIADMGFTMVWPTPLLENRQPQHSYHGYALTDYYRIDPRFGTHQDYLDFVATARQHGVGVLQDIVVNHIGTGHWWMRDLPDDDWIHHAKGPYVETNNRHTTVMDPYGAPEDRERFLNGWFDTSMPDLNQRHPLLARYLIQNSIWWIEEADLSGIREDTFAYADPDFLARWTRQILREYPRFNIVGEEMQDKPHQIAYWQKAARNRDGYDAGLPSLMDFAFSDNLVAILTEPEGWDKGLARLYDTVASDYLYADPMNLLVFADNHDRSRIFTVLGENLARWQNAMILVATVRGIPQVFYGTEILQTSPLERDDGRLRADFPGGWAGDRVNAFTGVGLAAEQRAMQGWLRRLLQWRKTSAAITQGKTLHYVPHDGTYVYFRFTPSERVMVVINKREQASTLDLGRFRSGLQGATSATDVLSGQGVDLRMPLALPAGQSRILQLR